MQNPTQEEARAILLSQIEAVKSGATVSVYHDGIHYTLQSDGSWLVSANSRLSDRLMILLAEQVLGSHQQHGQSGLSEIQPAVPPHVSGSALGQLKAPDEL